MSYTSYFYLLFFLGALVILYYLMPLKRRWLVLLGGSYFFYWLASGKLIVFLLITTVSVYLGALAMEREQKAFDSVRKSLEKEERKARKAAMMRRKRHIVLAMVLINVGLLAFLKYYHFFSANVNALGNSLNFGIQLPALKLVMPLGISFYTLSAVGYVIDVYRGQTAADHHFGRLALFLSLFTNITEGPISRYGQLAGQAFEGHRADYRQFTFGAQLILWGLFQKMVLADRAALLVSTVFGSPSDYSGGVVILAMLVYTLQIYADFAGCMDIVRGSGALFGIEITRNFHQPFFSRSIGEFWRRWHMTLGRWFKKYLYFPLGGSRCSFAKTIRNTFVVWAFTGLWHGASWNFVLWGLIFFVLLTIERLGLGKLLAKTKVLKHIYVIFLIPLTWVVFALPNMQDIATYFSRLFPFFADDTASFVNTKDVVRALHDYWYLLIASVVFCLPFPSRWYEKHKNSKLVILGLVLIYLMSVYKMQTQTSNPFLYYQF